MADIYGSKSIPDRELLRHCNLLLTITASFGANARGPNKLRWNQCQRGSNGVDYMVINASFLFEAVITESMIAISLQEAVHLLWIRRHPSILCPSC